MNNKRNIFPVVSFLWLLINIVIVCLVKGGEGIHRIETAAIIFAIAILSAAVYKKDPLNKRVKLKNSFYIEVFAIFFWVMALLQTFYIPFLSDDLVFAVKFSNWNNILGEHSFFRPLFNLVFSAVYNLFAGSVVMFHLLSVAIHFSSALLLKKIAKKIFKSDLATVGCFALFLLNPLQAEAVVWISGLQELMWSFFILLGVWIFIKDDNWNTAKYIKLFIVTVAALLSKETAISFVAVYLIFDLTLNGFRSVIEKWKLHAGSTILAILYLLLRNSMVTDSGEKLFTPDLYFLKSVLLAPYKVFYTPWNSLVSGEMAFARISILIIISSALLYTVIKKSSLRTVLTGAGIVLVTSLPVNKMLYIGEDLQGSRYLYFPYIGALLIIISLINILLKGRKLPVLLFIILVTLSGIVLKLNLGPWSEAGREMKKIVSELKSGKEPAKVPDNYKGAYILRNGYKELKILEKLNN